MNARRAVIAGTIVAFAGGVSVATAAYAKGEPVDPSKAAVTMSQAVATAEQQGGGKATRAKLENESGKLLYEVKVAGKDKATNVKVDAMDGKVLTANADTATHKHHGEKP
jgi:uncharacterized membrane protein YkoI